MAEPTPPTFSDDGGSADAANEFLKGQYENPNTFKFGDAGNDWVGRMDKTTGDQTQLLNDVMGWLTGGALGTKGGGQFASFGGGGGISMPAAPNIDYRMDRVELKELPPEIMAMMEANREQDTAALKLQRDQQNDALLSGLYGKGVNRSTVALDEAGRLNYAQDVALGEIRKSFNEQVMGGMNAQADRFAGLEAARMQANAQVAAAAQHAGASAAAARFSAASSALASVFGSQTNYNANLIDNYTSAGNNEVNANVSYQNNLVTSATNNLNNLRSNQTSIFNTQTQTQAQIKAARISANAQLKAAAMSYDLGQDRLAFDRENAAANLNLEWWKAMTGSDQAQQQINQNSTSDMDKFLQILMTLGGAYLGSGG